MMDGGGFGNAIVGTLVIVAIATVISVPLGILGAVYIADFGAETRIAEAVQFAAKVLTGLPSILAGVFAFAPGGRRPADFPRRPAARRWHC